MDRKSIIGVAICVLLLLFWYPLMHHLGWLPQRSRNVPPPEAPVSRTEGQAGGAAPVQAEAVSESGKAAGETGKAGSPAGAGSSRSAGTLPAPKPSGAVAEPSGLFVPRPISQAVAAKRATLTDGEYLSVDVDLDSGGASEVRLLQFEDDKGMRPHRIGSPRAPAAAVFPESSVAFGKARVVRKDARSVVIERKIEKSGLILVETWRLTDTPYEMEYRAVWRNEGSAGATAPGCFVPAGGVSLPAGGIKGRRGAGRLVMFLPEVDVLPVGARRSVMFSMKKIARTSLVDLRRFRRRPCQWVAVHSKYFVFGVRSGSDQPLPGFFLAMDAGEDGDKAEGGLLTGGVVLPEVPVAAGEEVDRTFRFYVGPKELRRLEAWAPAFTDVMRLDRFMFGLRPAWMGWMAKTLLRALIAVDRLVDTRWGFGWAIVVITVVIKILFWPLTHRSTVSMRKMQKIQPLIQEIREKYKSDPQKMNRKIMETYKEHNVSPFGGCLPLLLQIPVFFALFNVLRGAIELRHAHFLWVSDLSMPDTIAVLFGVLPIRPFALLMAGSMFIQQRLSPTSPDPSQARMMTFMTIFFAFLFYSMPAGLTLYWTTNQLLTIAQMALTNRLLGMEHSARAPADKG